MNNPTSTYRIQFHKDFNLEKFEKTIPYLKQLGVRTIYASPIFESTPGSTHGYDGVNPHQINPEIGTEQKLLEISESLKADGIQWLQDIVPNHMAFHQRNLWLTDVLEKGRQSVYASFFDIDWENAAYSGKLMVPFLGGPLEEVVEKDCHVEYSGGRFVLNYFDTLYPLNLRSYERILSLETTGQQDIRQLSSQLENIHQVEEPLILEQQWNEFLLQLSSLMKNTEVRNFVNGIFQRINNDKNLLLEIADEQFYQLAYWKDTDKQINFRRFFTVNGLICLNIQEEEVFDHFHSYIKSLVDKGVFQGLRIDHIDGLSDPDLYLQQLRKLAGDETYIVVEKILEPGEELPKNWPVQGNTGYDFLSMVNNLFTDKSAEKAFTKFYEKLSGDKKSVPEQIHEKKAAILNQHMAGELENLYRLFSNLNLVENDRFENEPNLKEAIGEFLIYCPVYRYYGNSFPLRDDEATAIQRIFDEIKKEKNHLTEAVELLEQVILIEPQKADEGYNSSALRFYQRCMQFTGPLMAKGVEDTLMYTYNRFIGHNEVGDALENFGFTTDEFHQLMIDRQANWPLSLNGTSTHDTKRGEDVRARLNVLTDLREDWIEAVSQWQFLNTDLSKQHRIDANDQYFIYQTLVGALPMPGEDETNLESRIHEYLIKALREAKVNSGWAEPNDDYETAAKNFASALLDKQKPFVNILRKFIGKIADFGIVNSLSQVLLKFTCPGVPDVYQGCELWDFSLVDPDNRRPIDYEMRKTLLEELKTGDLNQLWDTRYNGQIKLWLTHTLLQIRNTNPELFASADYIPLKVKGKAKEYIFAFARKYQQEWIILVVPLHLAKLSNKQQRKVNELKWKNTRIILPENAPEEFNNLITKLKSKVENEIFVKDIFENLPFAILRSTQPVTDRGAGILLHITSLPSPFGIGDFGPGAKKFADYLSNSGQKYWQLLPLSPTEEAQQYSPYSAISSMAGNTLLISPELLADEGLIEESALKKYYIKEKSVVDFAAAEKIKRKLFNKAYQTFIQNTQSSLTNEYQNFCTENADWLNNFALYVALKQHNDGKPWYEWADDFKLRDTEALEQFAGSNAESLDKIKWLQFIFLKQWTELKDYCNKLNIQLFGDLPFYVSNDSSDVWANKEIFCLDAEGKMTGVAGVPPDYFNDNGQLWGMPVFRWDVLKEQNYDWWVKRIKKNMQLYHLLRLDHFRAFSSYWDVPAGEETAKNGEWKPGPGSDFFNVIRKELGDLPFIAEDLGDVDQAVYDLRDEFDLPGMRVLQFTFSNDVAQSVHSPHNFTTNSVAYTGTHDNNTTKGWFRQDSNDLIKKNIKTISGIQPSEKNIHKILGRFAYSTVSRIVILPMQDVVGLDEKSRMNTPASVDSNWAWRLQTNQLKEKYSNRLKEWVKVFNR